jgi:hypothetical protein
MKTIIKKDVSSFQRGLSKFQCITKNNKIHGTYYDILVQENEWHDKKDQISFNGKTHNYYRKKSLHYFNGMFYNKR